jgi:trimethylguanosine synthase
MIRKHSKDICPFGPHLQHYWDRLTEREREMMLDEEGLFSLAPEPVALHIAGKTPGDLIADAFCGAGGSAIGFARAGKRVVAIDNNSQRLVMARHNAKLFGVEDDIEFIHGDCRDVLPALRTDTVFLDPPWGGTDYYKAEKFHLSDFEPDWRALLELSFSLAPSVVLRLPRNFAMDELDGLGRTYETERNTFNGRFIHYCVYFS